MTYPALVDTGSALIYVPPGPYQAFLDASGGEDDIMGTGFTRWSTEPTENFVFTIGSTAFTLTPSQYLIPQDQ